MPSASNRLRLFDRPRRFEHRRRPLLAAVTESVHRRQRKRMLLKKLQAVGEAMALLS